MIKHYTIKDGDTLQDIASRELGNPSFWVKIAIQNGLFAPYIGELGVQYPKKVLYPGNLIVLTAEDNSDEIYYLERNISTIDYDAEFYGIDVGLVNGQLVLTGGSDGVDLFTKSGISNMKQAILHKFMVDRGSYMYYNSYGTIIQSFVGQALDNIVMTRIKAEVIKTITQDKRVQNITNISVTVTDNEHVKCFVDVELISGKQTTLDLELKPNSIGLN